MTRARQTLMTRRAFEEWMSAKGRAIYIDGPYDVLPCRCGDVNCHGWRFVGRAPAHRSQGASDTIGDPGEGWVDDVPARRLEPRT